MVSPGPSVKITRGRRRGKRKLHRPQDIREGVTNAYYIVKDVSDLKMSIDHETVSNVQIRIYTYRVSAIQRIQLLNWQPSNTIKKV